MENSQGPREDAAKDDAGHPLPGSHPTRPLLSVAPGAVPLPLTRSDFLSLVSLAPAQVVERLAQLLESPPQHSGPVTVAFMNMRNFVAARQDPEAISAYSVINQIYPDGAGLQIGRHLARLPAFPRVSGTDTVPLLLARLPAGTRVFLLGGNAEVSAAAASRFSQLFPDVLLVGVQSGYLTAADDTLVVAAIAGSKADILLIGMGSPLQEQWLARNRLHLTVRLAICVGGLFHYWAGDLHRAPHAVRAVGLEWLWILAQQPFKWRVYSIDAVFFAVAMMRSKRQDSTTAPTGFDVSPSRLRLKKAARRIAVGLGRLLRLPDAPGAESIRVLTYHRFGLSPLDPFCLQPQAFEEQLDWLSEHCTVLTPDSFDAVMSGKLRTPPNAVLITIDDGHGSVAAHALPALDSRGLKAVLFVCPGLIETSDTALQGYGGFMDWRMLAGAAAGGHTIAAHGYTHRSLGRLPLAEAIAEIDRASEALATRLCTRSPFFSFPFGTRADYSTELAGALAERGFRYCFTSMHGRCRPGSGSVLLPRIKIEGGNEEDLFPHIARGAMDHWRYVDHALYHLQQRGRM